MVLRLTILFIASMMLSAPVAKSQQLNRSLVQLAVEAGVFAGAAEYCQIDREKVEAFIGRILGQLGAQARDDTDRALLRSTFKNQQIAARVREPDGGCERFIIQFEKALNSGL